MNAVDDNILSWMTEKVANKPRILLPTQGITLTVGNVFFIHISSEFNNEFRIIKGAGQVAFKKN